MWSQNGEAWHRVHERKEALEASSYFLPIVLYALLLHFAFHSLEYLNILNYIFNTSEIKT